MKKLPIMKNAFLILLLFAAIIEYKPAKGQMLTARNETAATFQTLSYTASNAKNTGTDACLTGSDSTYIAVTVWDGPDGGMGWRFNNGTRLKQIRWKKFRYKFLNDTITYLAKGLDDPDVAVTKSGTDSVFAVVACVLPQKMKKTDTLHPTALRQIVLFQFRMDWTDSTLKFVRMCGPYGRGDSTASSYSSLSPNIDANVTGDFALVWAEQQTASTSLDMTIGSTTKSVSGTMKRGNIVSIEGVMNQSWRSGAGCPACSLGTNRSSTDRYKVDLIGVSNDGANVQISFADPDVSISERKSGSTSAGDTTAVKSYVFYRDSTSLLNSAVRKLVLVQVKSNKVYVNYHTNYGQQTSFHYYPYRTIFPGFPINANLTPPRIAAPADTTIGHCSIVLSDTSTYQEKSLKSYASYAYLVGKRRDSLINYKSLAIFPTLGQYKISSCAIAYTQDSASTPNPRLNVVFEVSNSPHIMFERNIVARWYDFSGSAITPFYSIIHRQHFDDQAAPSIAARKLIGFKGRKKPCSYAFYSHYAHYAAYYGVRLGTTQRIPGTQEFDYPTKLDTRHW